MYIYQHNNPEIWKGIPGHEGFYEVSNLGRIKRLARIVMVKKNLKEKIMKPSFYSDGRLRIVLRYGGMWFRRNVHNLVNMVFNNGRNNKYLTFKDGNPRNCRADNIIKYSEKSTKRSLSKREEESVRDLYRNRCSTITISKIHNVSQRTIYTIIKRL